MILSEEQQLIRETARSFAQTVLVPQAADNDKHARFPAQAV